MFCINCGKEIGKTRYCPYCGSENELIKKKVNKIATSSRETDTLANANHMPGSQSHESQAYDKANNQEQSNRAKRTIQSDGLSKSTPKGLKATVFTLLGISCILVVLIFVISFARIDSPPDIGPIIEGSPRVSDEVFTDWNKGDYSISNIGNSSDAVDDDFTKP